MLKIGFIGSGRMTQAMVVGLCRSGMDARKITLLSKSGNTSRDLADKVGCQYAEDLQSLIEQSEVIILALKPQQLSELDEKSAIWSRGKVVFSVLAGTTLSRLKAVFPEVESVVRIMPNTPGQIGWGISGYSYEGNLSKPVEHLLGQLLDSLGKSIRVPEDQLNALTALSGSGPAFVFEFIAGLRDGGIKNGLSPEIAAQLAVQTVLGSAKLVEQSSLTPEEQRDQVTSKGGTTFAGLSVLESANFRKILEKTLTAATQRAEELSQG